MNRRNEEEDMLTAYYLEQTGHGSEIYSGQVYQKGEIQNLEIYLQNFLCVFHLFLLIGYGIGSFLGGLFRYVIPLIKKGSAIVGKELLKSSANVFNDIADNKSSFNDSIKTRGLETIDRLKRRGYSGMTGSGIPSKRRRLDQSKSASGRVKKSNKKSLKKPKKASSKKKPLKKKSKKVVKKKKKSSKIPSDARFAYL